MAVKKPELKKFNIYAKGTWDASVEIEAQTFQEAIEQAENMKATDFIQFLDEHFDSSIELKGVHIL